MSATARGVCLLLWLVRLSVQDPALSRRRGGFDSHTGYSGGRSGRGKAWPIRKLGGLETAGSNPAALTRLEEAVMWEGPSHPPALGAGERRFDLDHPDRRKLMTWIKRCTMARLLTVS